MGCGNNFASSTKNRKKTKMILERGFFVTIFVFDQCLAAGKVRKQVLLFSIFQ